MVVGGFRSFHVLVTTEDKHRDTCMYTSYFKREPRTNSTLPIHFPNQAVKINTRKGYVYTNVGRVALIFQTELTEESVV